MLNVLRHEAVNYTMSAIRIYWLYKNAYTGTELLSVKTKFAGNGKRHGAYEPWQHYIQRGECLPTVQDTKLNHCIG